MNQGTIPFYIEAVLARNPGAVVTTHLAPYEKRRGYYTVAEIRRADGNLIQRASGPSRYTALDNLDVVLSLR